MKAGCSAVPSAVSTNTFDTSVVWSFTCYNITNGIYHQFFLLVYFWKMLYKFFFILALTCKTLLCFDPQHVFPMLCWLQTPQTWLSSSVLSVCPAPPLDSPLLSSGWTAALRLQPATEFSSLMEAPLWLYSTWSAMMRNDSGVMYSIISVMASVIL